MTSITENTAPTVPRSATDARAGLAPHGIPGEGSAILCRRLTQHYGEGNSKVVALRGVELRAEYGELMMLVGPSGCGKTTLISVIAGILDHDEGDVHVLGSDLDTLRGGQLTRWRGENIGFVFQQFNLLPTLTAAENVAIPLMLLGESRQVAVRRATDMLARVALGDRARSLPSQLSGGQQQRVAIARALVHSPRLLVCDEPTSALDAETGQKVMTLFREVALSRERVLLIVTHDSRIFGFADRIARMNDGRVIDVTSARASPAPAD